MSDKICKKCNSKFIDDRRDYIIPESYKNRNRKNNKISYLYPDKNNYIKPSRLQIFNDQNDDIEKEEEIIEEISDNEEIPEDEIHNNNNIKEINNDDKNYNYQELNQVDLKDNLIQLNQNYKNNKNLKKSKLLVFRNLEEILPREIAGEILLGKFKGVFKIFCAVIFIIYSILSIWYYFLMKNGHNIKISHISNIFLSLPIGIIVLIFGVFWILLGFFQYNNFRLYSNKYNNEFSNDSKQAEYPPFLREIYIKRIKMRYYIILFASLIYTLSLFIIPILYLIQTYAGKDFSFAWWNIGKTPDVQNVILSFWIIVGIATLILLINILINEKRHSIINIYTSNNVLSEIEKKEISKTTKRKCLIIYFIFLSTLIILFIIPTIIFLWKKMKNKKIIN